MEIGLRKVEENDLLFLKQVYRSTREEELALTKMSPEEKNQFVDFQFNAQHAHYLKAYQGADFQIVLLDGEQAGRLYLWETESQIRIMDIALLGQFRGKGVGTKILNDLIQDSESKGKRLTIHVEYFNPALRLYERLNFKRTDDTGIYYFMERQPEVSNT